MLCALELGERVRHGTEQPMGPEPLGGVHAAVRGGAQQRMGDAQPFGREAEQFAPPEHVSGSGDLSRLDARQRGDGVDVQVTDDSDSAEDRLSVGVERADVGAERPVDARHLIESHAVQRRLERLDTRTLPPQLRQQCREERIAVAVLDDAVEGLPRSLPRYAAHDIGREGREANPVEGDAAPAGRLEERVRHLGRTVRHEQDEPRCVQQQRDEDAERRLVDPVDIVDDEDRRLLAEGSRHLLSQRGLATAGLRGYREGVERSLERLQRCIGAHRDRARADDAASHVGHDRVEHRGLACPDRTLEEKHEPVARRLQTCTEAGAFALTSRKCHPGGLRGHAPRRIQRKVSRASTSPTTSQTPSAIATPPRFHSPPCSSAA